MDYPIIFTVRCKDGPGPYYRVYIFEDVDSMRAWGNTHDIQKRKGYFKGCEAHVQAMTAMRLRKGHWRKLLYIGWVAFHKGNIGSGIVSHEMTHAALYFMGRWKRRLRMSDANRRFDECLAWTQGWLVKQFWDKYYKRFPYEEPQPARQA